MMRRLSIPNVCVLILQHQLRPDLVTISVNVLRREGQPFAANLWRDLEVCASLFGEPEIAVTYPGCDNRKPIPECEGDPAIVGE